MTNQQKNSFDEETIKKILRGALIAGGGAAAIFILNALGQLDAGGLTPVVAFLVPFLGNTIREYLKGVDKG